jgi:hypoxanthine phosphoribosyltransferase
MPDNLDLLISAEAIAERTREIAAEIDGESAEPLLLIAILKGSVHFLSDLGRCLKRDTEVDFIQVSSYQDQKRSSGIVQIRKDSDINLENRNVLIVEDIVDTGQTLKHLRELLATRNPKSLEVAALLSKPEARKVQVPIEHVGFEIPNEFVVGYGLDYAERYRNLPYIAILREG